jgi:hydroxymethylglutaryl-CoA reductase
MHTHNSRLGGLSQLNPSERLQVIETFEGLCDEDLRRLRGRTSVLTIESVDKMIENVVGTFNLPLGIATNFQINGRDMLLPYGGRGAINCSRRPICVKTPFISEIK